MDNKKVINKDGEKWITSSYKNNKNVILFLNRNNNKIEQVAVKVNDTHWIEIPVDSTKSIIKYDKVDKGWNGVEIDNNGNHSFLLEPDA